MSTLVQDLVDDAALQIGDPNKQRVQLSQWHSIYNRSNRALGEKANVFRYLDQFTLVAGQMKYDYPQLMTVMNGIRVSETPSDETTFQVIEEIFEDEWRNRTSGLYPTATLPDSYFATSNWFWLVPMATNQIVDGACIDYFGLPDTISYTSFTASGTVIQAEDFAQDYLVRRMVIHGMEARNRWQEAKDALSLWEADMETFMDKLDDRSQDRRSSLRTRRPRFAGMR